MLVHSVSHLDPRALTSFSFLGTHTEFVVPANSEHTRCVFDAATYIWNNPKELLHSTSSIYGYARIHIESKGGHFGHLLPLKKKFYKYFLVVPLFFICLMIIP
jgi:hypothetical protein